jgi:hypothetical protein
LPWGEDPPRALCTHMPKPTPIPALDPSVAERATVRDNLLLLWPPLAGDGDCDRLEGGPRHAALRERVQEVSATPAARVADEDQLAAVRRGEGGGGGAPREGRGECDVRDDEHVGAAAVLLQQRLPAVVGVGVFEFVEKVEDTCRDAQVVSRGGGGHLQTLHGLYRFLPSEPKVDAL